MVAASKRFTVHHAPKVFTVCLNRREDFTSRKISKVCMQLERNFLIPEQGISQGSQCALSQAVRVELFVFSAGERRVPMGRQARTLLQQSCFGQEQFPDTQSMTCKAISWSI